MIESVLVANRGEIALRIVRACRELGVRSIAVYSEPDRLAPHVLAADESHCIGGAAAADSYLRAERLLEVARDSGASAIHPGYGFLAERAVFARAVEDAGIVFIGPRSDTIAAMGDKTEARRRMRAAGVPVVPGIDRAAQSPQEALSVAAEIGFPVLLKAAAGGGGKGMRVVETPEALPSALEAAGREALSAFGDDSVYIERFLDRPRHIEIQVPGDGAGNVLHLGERECSIQRRHQKLVEEAPSPMMSEVLRADMGRAAVEAAAAVGYVSAGTVEFLYQDGEYYFLEMNTRLQVEHPVTELTTGIDLVHWQLKIASGEELDFTQEDVRFEGHAIECRITSEDAARGFLPSTGIIDHLEVPGGPGVRWDGGIAQGIEIGLHYDPLLGKLVVHAPDRQLAIARMTRALDELVITGIDTIIPFHRRVMDDPDFARGDLSILFIEEHPSLTASEVTPDQIRRAAVAAALLADDARRASAAPRITDPRPDEFSAWRAPTWSWRPGGRGSR